MLKGISHLLSPELLSVLYKMGHGDEIILADAHFPGESYNNNVLRADGIKIPDLLEAILPLFELDHYVDYPLVMMSAVEGDQLDANVELSYMKSIKKTNSNVKSLQRVDRYAFYERASEAYAVVITGETAKYGNILLKKGVTPIETSKIIYCE
ncbi:L-fucose mutarotase [Marinifilum sp. RC60d5]|uniref:L-fucose mutarotase n=1 Tax=Marinifilum sp. RC60d5 TaxID=3458414 RepID=UPI004035FE4E